MHAEICIIGSGLSAMAAAAALAARGCRPLILDTGLEPDPEARSLRGRLATAEPEDWRAEDLARLRRTGPPAANGIPRKLWFGSDFAFREMGPAVKMDLRNASVHRSFAAGVGLLSVPSGPPVLASNRYAAPALSAPASSSGG